MPKFKFFKLVNRYDPRLKMLRLFRIIWTKGEWGKGGYDAKLSVALKPAIFRFHREHGAWLLTLCGVRLHYQKSFSMGMC